jgi:hypothetical protein
MRYSMTAKRITSDMIGFLNDNVFSVTQLIRNKKLAEILDSFSKKDHQSTDVYVIQNTKKACKAVIIDLHYFQKLLLYKEAVEQAMDKAMDEIALERKDSATYIPIEQVIEEHQLDMGRIIQLMNEVEEED